MKILIQALTAVALLSGAVHAQTLPSVGISGVIPMSDEPEGTCYTNGAIAAEGNFPILIQVSCFQEGNFDPIYGLADHNNRFLKSEEIGLTPDLWSYELLLSSRYLGLFKTNYGSLEICRFADGTCKDFQKVKEAVGRNLGGNSIAGTTIALGQNEVFFASTNYGSEAGVIANVMSPNATWHTLPQRNGLAITSDRVYDACVPTNPATLESSIVAAVQFPDPNYPEINSIEETPVFGDAWLMRFLGTNFSPVSFDCAAGPHGTFIVMNDLPVSDMILLPQVHESAFLTLPGKVLDLNERTAVVNTFTNDLFLLFLGEEQNEGHPSFLRINSTWAITHRNQIIAQSSDGRAIVTSTLSNAIDDSLLAGGNFFTHNREFEPTAEVIPLHIPGSDSFSNSTVLGETEVNSSGSSGGGGAFGLFGGLLILLIGGARRGVRTKK